MIICWRDLYKKLDIPPAWTLFFFFLARDLAIWKRKLKYITWGREKGKRVGAHLFFPEIVAGMILFFNTSSAGKQQHKQFIDNKMLILKFESRHR